MAAISLFNDVIGPVMRGPSSSHTAAPVQIGTLARALLGDEPAAATFVFDAGGSFAEVYRQQGSDLGLAAGLLGWRMEDERFPQALEWAAAHGLDIRFAVEPLPQANHPNTLAMQLVSRGGRMLRATAQSIGGGAFVFTELEGWPVRLTGDAYEVIAEVEPEAEAAVCDLLVRDGPRRRTRRDKQVASATCLERQGPGPAERALGLALVHARRLAPLDAAAQLALEALPGLRRLWTAPPVFYPQRGRPLFDSAAAMVEYAEARGGSLGRAALATRRPCLACRRPR